MNLKNIFALPSATFFAIVLSSAAFGAGQGSLNSTSTGSSDLSLTINDSVMITGLNDVTFPAYGAANTGDIAQGDAFCVYRNGQNGYNITATNPNGSEFSITSAATGDTVQYTLALDESADASSANTVAYDTAISFTSGSDEVDCGDETSSVNTAFEIRIAEQEIRDATSGTYIGTLQLVLAPE
jgi:hypothetical protein